MEIPVEINGFHQFLNGFERFAKKKKLCFGGILDRDPSGNQWISSVFLMF